MARRNSSGVLSAWAEAQRRRQREIEAQQRAFRAAQQDQARAQRAAARAQARNQGEALKAYQYGRDADAAARTSELDARIAGLAHLLQSVLAAPPFQLRQLMREAAIPSFAPGPLSVPVMMPDPRAYQVPAPTGLRGRTPAGRREHQEEARRAQAQFDQDSRAAGAAEAARQRQLADYHRQYQEWAGRERQRIGAYNSEVQRISDQVTSGDRDAVREYFTAALYATASWPADFPRAARIDWDAAERHLLVDWELPDFSVVPEVGRYRYIKADDREALKGALSHHAQESRSRGPAPD